MKPVSALHQGRTKSKQNQTQGKSAGYGKAVRHAIRDVTDDAYSQSGFA